MILWNFQFEMMRVHMVSLKFLMISPDWTSKKLLEVHFWSTFWSSSLILALDLKILESFWKKERLSTNRLPSTTSVTLTRKPRSMNFSNRADRSFSSKQTRLLISSSGKKASFLTEKTCRSTSSHFSSLCSSSGLPVYSE